MRHTLLAVLVLVMAPVLALSSGCGLTPSRPDSAAWSQAARQALEDVASEVATVKVAVEQQERGRQLGKYAVVTATTSEEALGKAADSLLTQQPPASRRDDYDRVSTALGDAEDLVAGARIALVAGDSGRYAGLAHRLDRMADRLDSLRGAL